MIPWLMGLVRARLDARAAKKAAAEQEPEQQGGSKPTPLSSLRNKLLEQAKKLKDKAVAYAKAPGDLLKTIGRTNPKDMAKALGPALAAAAALGIGATAIVNNNQQQQRIEAQGERVEQLERELAGVDTVEREQLDQLRTQVDELATIDQLTELATTDELAELQTELATERERTRSTLKPASAEDLAELQADIENLDLTNPTQVDALTERLDQLRVADPDQVDQLRESVDRLTADTLGLETSSQQQRADTDRIETELRAEAERLTREAATLRETTSQLTAADRELVEANNELAAIDQELRAVTNTLAQTSELDELRTQVDEVAAREPFDPTALETVTAANAARIETATNAVLVAQTETERALASAVEATSQAVQAQTAATEAFTAATAAQTVADHAVTDAAAAVAAVEAIEPFDPTALTETDQQLAAQFDAAQTAADQAIADAATAAEAAETAMATATTAAATADQAVSDAAAAQTTATNTEIALNETNVQLVDTINQLDTTDTALADIEEVFYADLVDSWSTGLPVGLNIINPCNGLDPWTQTSGERWTARNNVAGTERGYCISFVPDPPTFPAACTYLTDPVLRWAHGNSRIYGEDGGSSGAFSYMYNQQKDAIESSLYDENDGEWFYDSLRGGTVERPAPTSLEWGTPEAFTLIANLNYAGTTDPFAITPSVTASIDSIAATVQADIVCSR